MSKDFGDNVYALLISQDAARHWTTDEFTVVHEQIPYAKANVVRENNPLVDWYRFDTLSPTLGCGPPVQRGKENRFAGKIQSITAG